MCSGTSDRTLRLGALLVGTVLGCGGYRSNPAAVPCEPPKPGALAPLPAGVSAERLAGRYRLTLVATSGPDSGSRVQGDLTLASGSREAGPVSPALVGTARIAVERVGAVETGDLGSTDPMRPGVMVFHKTTGDSAWIMLRLGSESNRQDQQAFESAYTVLDVRQVSESGFAGSWKSGVTGTVAEGYFCAILTAQSAPIPGGFDAGLH